MYKNHSRVIQFIRQDISRHAVLVVGDVMLDRYYFGEVKRISAEAPVPVTRVRREKETLGGAANVAHNLALLGCKTFIAGVTGDDENRIRLCNLLDAKGISHEGLLTRSGPTTTKVRIVGGHQQMLRLDFEEAAPLKPDIEDKLIQYIRQIITANIGSVIISDYAKGVCTPNVCQFIIEQCACRNIPVIVDPKGNDWSKYRGVPYITPNLKELKDAVHIGIANTDEDVRRAAQYIKRKYRIQNVVITRSEKGLSLVGARRCIHISTQAREVFDVSGAGDTVIAVFGAALAVGMESIDAAQLANLAAGVVVGKVGTYAISRAELIEAVRGMSNSAQ